MSFSLTSFVGVATSLRSAELIGSESELLESVIAFIVLYDDEKSLLCEAEALYSLQEGVGGCMEASMGRWCPLAVAIFREHLVRSLDRHLYHVHSTLVLNIR